MNVNTSDTGRDSLATAEPAPQIRVYQRIASCSIALKVRVSSVFLSGRVCRSGATRGAEKDVRLGLSRACGSVWRDVRLKTVENSPTGHGITAHYMVDTSTTHPGTPPARPVATTGPQNTCPASCQLLRLEH